MRTPLLFLLALSSPLLAQTSTPEAPTTPSPATAPSVSGDDAKILEKFAQAQKDFEGRKKDIAAAALGRFTSGAASEAAALQLYFTCQQIVQDRVPDLDGDTKKDAKEQQERLKQQAEQMAEIPGFSAVLQLQLQYLVLTMEAPTIKERSVLITRLKDFAGKAVDIMKTYTSPPGEPQHKVVATVGSGKGKREQEKQRDAQREERARQQVIQLARQSAMGSIFAQAYSLQNYFKPVEGWPPSALDLPAIYTGMVLPYYRETKKEFVAPTWDEYLGHEATLQRCSLDDRGYARWGIGAYKNLIWSKWMDLFHNGVDRMTAADELAKLCKENPAHPSVGAWMQQLSELANTIKNGSATAEAAP
jgi:hypothetical protein